MATVTKGPGGRIREGILSMAIKLKGRLAGVPILAPLILAPPDLPER